MEKCFFIVILIGVYKIFRQNTLKNASLQAKTEQHIEESESLECLKSGSFLGKGKNK